MNKQIQAIIFDIGGVIIRTLDHSGRAAWEARLGLPAGGAEALILNGEMGKKAQRGEISDSTLWQWVREQFGLGEHLAEFRHDFWRGDSIDPRLVDLIDRLRPSYRTAVISNATDALLTTLTGYGLMERFDVIVGSAYEGVMKPDPIIYERTLDRLQCKPEESVFIDDSPINIAAAEKLGMSAIHFSPTLDLETALRQLGVEPPVKQMTG